MRKKKDAPYYLLIHTDSYTGNFERELVAYCIGKLDDMQKGHSYSYSKAFWNSVGGSDINSYEEYIKAEEELSNEFGDKFNELFKSLEEFTTNVEKILEDDVEFQDQLKEVQQKNKKIEEEKNEKHISRLYDTYLCSTYQEVDDWEQSIFYNIESFYKNEKHNCDTIYIQLNKPLSEYFENIVIERIKGFFENNVYNVIQNYDWVCSFGHVCSNDENLKLLDLELVDQDYNLIKKYI